MTGPEAGTRADKPDLDTDLRAVWDKDHANRWSDGKSAPREPTAGRPDQEPMGEQPDPCQATGPAPDLAER